MDYATQKNLLFGTMDLLSVNLEQICKRYRLVFQIIRLNAFKYEPNIMKTIISSAINFEEFLESVKFEEEYPLQASDVLIMHSLFFIPNIGEDLKVSLNENIADFKTHTALMNFVDLFLEKTGHKSPESFCFSSNYSASYQKSLLKKLVQDKSSFKNTLLFLAEQTNQKKSTLQLLNDYIEDNTVSKPALKKHDLEELRNSIAYLSLIGSFRGIEGEEHINNFKIIIEFINNM